MRKPRKYICRIDPAISRKVKFISVEADNCKDAAKIAWIELGYFFTATIEVFHFDNINKRMFKHTYKGVSVI